MRNYEVICITKRRIPTFSSESTWFGGTTNITRTLPTVTDNIGKLYILKKVDTSIYTVNIMPTLGQTIDNISTGYLLELENEFVQLIGRNNTSWGVVSE